MSQLNKLLPVTPANIRLMADIRTLVAQKMAEINQSIQVRTRQGFNAAAAIVRTNIGKHVMDLLRVKLGAINDRYNRTAFAEKMVATRRSQLTKIADATFGLLLLMTLSGLYLRFVRALRLRKKHTDKLIQKANHDSLTHLPNRALFLNWLTYGLSQADRTHGNAAILFLDLDGFKPVNDRLGHGIGDHVLCEVAQRFKHATRGSDMIARIGGDEFAIFIPVVSDESDLVTLADRIIESMCEPIVSDGAVVHMGVSIGAAVYPRNGPDPASLLAAADQAMYHSKREGGGKLVLHNSTE